MYNNSIGGDILWSRRSSLSYFMQKEIKNFTDMSIYGGRKNGN